MTLQTRRRFISSPGEGSGQSPLASPVGPMHDPYGPSLAPASRSAKPGKGAVLMTRGTCGPTYLDSSAASETLDDCPLSSWESRLRERLAMLGSTESALIWRRKDTGFGWSISRLAPWTPPTSASGSIGSHSPTPTVADVQGGRKARSGARANEPLLNGICHAAYNPTPTSLSGGSETSNPPGNARSVNKMLEQRFGPERGNALSGPAPSGSPATTEKRGVPNPVFAMWLMGFPQAWIRSTLLALSITASSSRLSKAASRRGKSPATPSCLSSPPK